MSDLAKKLNSDSPILQERILKNPDTFGAGEGQDCLPTLQKQGRRAAVGGVPGELLILGDFRHFAIHGSRSARRSRSVHSVVAESVLGEYRRYPATRSFEAGDIKPGSGRHQAAAGV